MSEARIPAANDRVLLQIRALKDDLKTSRPEVEAVTRAVTNGSWALVERSMVAALVEEITGFNVDLANPEARALELIGRLKARLAMVMFPDVELSRFSKKLELLNERLAQYGLTDG